MVSRSKVLCRDEKRLRYLSIEALRPHEEHDPGWARMLGGIIAGCGIWTEPIVVERETLCVMDGHHRLAAARILGLHFIPCAVFSYPEVAVCSRRPEYAIDSGTIIARSMRGQLFPPRTTRHIFPFKPRCHTPLHLLRGLHLDQTLTASG